MKRTMNPRTETQPHSTCHRADLATQGRGTVGRVRLCRHGKVQVLTDANPASAAGNSGPLWWETLHPVFNFREFRRAMAVLRGRATSL